MFERGFFGKMFDLDGDGKLNAFEMAADFTLFNELMNEDKTRTRTILTMISRMSPIIKGKIIANNIDRTYAEDIFNKMFKG